jgi:hypothetical protein
MPASRLLADTPLENDGKRCLTVNIEGFGALIPRGCQGICTMHGYFRNGFDHISYDDRSN